MTEYYVAVWGDDTDPGTKDKPYKTIQRGCDIAQPGDFVIALEGQFDERVQVNGAGSPGMMITIQADGLVVMKGFTILADWITARYFEITGTPNVNRDGFGVYLAGDNCLIEDNYIHFATRGGILIENRENDHISDCVIRKNRLYRNAMYGIAVHGRNHLIEENEVSGTIQNHPDWIPLPSWADADGMRFHGSGHVFRKNRIWGIHYSDPLIQTAHIDCFQTFEVAGSHEAASNILFEQNYCEALTSQAENENGTCFMLGKASDVIIRNNILKAYSGINAHGGSDNLTVVNNLFVNDLSFQQFYPKAIGMVDVSNAIVRNNVFYDQPYHTISIRGDISSYEVDHNLAFRSDGQPSDCFRIDWECVEPKPSDLWDVDPLFVNPNIDNYRLREDSPAIDAGIEISEVFDDYEGNPRPQGEDYDIGPSEYMENAMSAKNVDMINISNWQETGSSVPIPQYQFDLEIKWTDQDGEKHQHNGTYRYPNDISAMPNNVRKRYAEEMIIATARVMLGINEWEDYV